MINFIQNCQKVQNENQIVDVWIIFCTWSAIYSRHDTNNAIQFSPIISYLNDKAFHTGCTLDNDILIKANSKNFYEFTFWANWHLYPLKWCIWPMTRSISFKWTIGYLYRLSTDTQFLKCFQILTIK